MLLFHATSEKKLANILKSGYLRDKSYWSIDDDKLMNYYMETIEDEGEIPVVIVVKLEDTDILLPDRHGIEEPITSAIGLSESEVWEEWEKSGQDAQASIDIIGSVVVDNSIIANRLLSYPDLKQLVKNNLSLEL